MGGGGGGGGGGGVDFQSCHWAVDNVRSRPRRRSRTLRKKNHTAKCTMNIEGGEL